MAYQQKPEQGEFIKNEIQKYLRYWYWFVLGVVLAYAAAFIYLRYTPKVYSSTAKIKMLNKTKGLELPSAAFVFNRSNINIENEIEILKSSRIIDQVVKNLDLTMRFYEEGNVLTTEIGQLPFSVIKTITDDNTNWANYKIEVTEKGLEVSRGGTESPIRFPNYSTLGVSHQLPFELNLLGNTDFTKLSGKVYLISMAPVTAITKQVKGGLGVSVLGKNSDLLELKFTSQSESKNERILNELIRVFNEDGINDRRNVSLRTIDFIDGRFNLIVKELDSIETSIKDYKQDNNLINIESDGALGLTQRTEAETALFEIENQLLLSDLLKSGLNEPNDTSDLLPANIGLSSGNINTQVDDYNTLVLERDNLIISAGSNNPQVIRINNQLRDLKANIFASIAAYNQQLNVTKKRLEQQNRKFSAQVYSIPDKEKTLLDIRRQQEIKQTLYIFLLQKREEAAINLAITEPTLKVVEYALSQGWPISPNSKSIYTTALMAGLAIPFAIIYLLFLLDTKVKSRKDIEHSNTKVPIVAELPIMKKKANWIFTNPNDTSIQAEAFRILSSNVEYVLPVTDRKDGKVIYCTSSIKGEGKTYVSLNLSLALSSLNKKVLLIGSDLRNPQIHSYLGKNKNQEGLSNYLYDYDFDWRTALIQGFDSHPQHHILMAGSMPPNPAHLLTNGRFKDLIAAAKAEFDFIIVDTAPTILVTDTMLISSMADVTIYMVRAHFTEKKLLEFSNMLSESGKLKNMAFVLNGVDANKSRGYYSYNYGYDYGYGKE